LVRIAFIAKILLLMASCSAFLHAIDPSVTVQSESGELLYVDLKVNEQLCNGIFPVVLDGGRVWLASEQVPQLNLNSSVFLPKKTMMRQEFSLLPDDVRFDLDRENLVLNVYVPEGAMATVLIGDNKRHISISPKTYAFYWNYNLAGFHDPIGKNVVIEAAHKPVLATPFGSFINQFLTNVVPAKIVRLETSYAIDFIDHDLRLTAGDSANDAPSWGNHVAMAGIKLQKDFLFETGSLSYPTISLPGFAPRVGQAQVWVNDSLSVTKDLPRGGFLLDNVNLPAGAHSGSLVVRDPSGIVSTTPFSYYADPELLRAGTHAFSYSLGFLRKDYGVKSFSYGEPVFAGSHKIGATNFLTPALHIEATPRLIMAGDELRLRLWSIGSTAIGSAISYSQRNGRGYMIAPEINFHFWRFITGARAQFSSRGFQAVGVSDESTAYRTSIVSSSFRVDAPYITHTSLGYLLVHSKTPRVHSVGLRQNLPLIDDLAISVNADYDFARNNFGIYCFIGASLPYQHRMSAHAQAKGRDFGGATSISMSPDDKKETRFGYDVVAGVEQKVYGQGGVNVDTEYVASRVRAFGARDQFHYLAELNGSFGGVKDELFFSRTVNGGLLLIELPDQHNVKVWRDNNTLLGKTDDEGRLVVTNLRPFETANIGLDVKDLDPSTKSDGVGQNFEVTPGFQTAHNISLSAPIVRNIQFRLLLDKKTLPPGTMIQFVDIDESFVMTDGSIYIEVPQDRTAVKGRALTSPCHFTVAVPSARESIIEELGDVHCQQ
jgi:outer membrane usher protein